MKHAGDILMLGLVALGGFFIYKLIKGNSAAGPAYPPNYLPSGTTTGASSTPLPGQTTRDDVYKTAVQTGGSVLSALFSNLGDIFDNGSDAKGTAKVDTQQANSQPYILGSNVNV